jgi:ABC-type Na+ efflux pump permease subunit
MERTVVTTSFEAIPVELPATLLAVVADEGLEIFEIFQTTGYFDPYLVWISIAAGVRHCRAD